jgi:hypothetical protein
MVSLRSVIFQGNIAAEGGDLRDIEEWLASFNRAQLDDSNAPRMEAIGVELAKPTGVDGFFKVH